MPSVEAVDAATSLFVEGFARLHGALCFGEGTATADVEDAEDVNGFRVVLVVDVQCESDDERLQLFSAGERYLLLLRLLRLLLLFEADLLLG